MSSSGEAPPTIAVAEPAATIVLLRPAVAGDGVETLLLKRHGGSAAFAGAYVFPGGKVGDADRSLDPASWSLGDLDAASETLGADGPEAALGFLVAAVRETFEEAGVLLARRTDGTALTAADLERTTFIDARRRLASRSERWDWSPWLRQEGVVLDLGALAFWAWWVTPVHRPHRFDTRFFVAALPPGQHASHDEVETTELRWRSPRAALAERDEGAVHLRVPTAHNLELIGRYPGVEAVLGAARRGEVDRRRMQPRVVRDGDGLSVEYEFGAPPQTTLPSTGS